MKTRHSREKGCVSGYYIIWWGFFFVCLIFRKGRLVLSSSCSTSQVCICTVVQVYCVFQCESTPHTAVIGRHWPPISPTSTAIDYGRSGKSGQRNNHCDVSYRIKRKRKMKRKKIDGLESTDTDLLSM